MTDIPLPRVIPARPPGDWRDPERIVNDALRDTGGYDPGPSIPTLPEAALTDKLRQIAMLLRALTWEELMTMAEGMKRPDLPPTLIAWAKHYMDPETNPQPQPPERRA